MKCHIPYKKQENALQDISVNWVPTLQHQMESTTLVLQVSGVEEVEIQFHICFLLYFVAVKRVHIIVLQMNMKRKNLASTFTRTLSKE